MPYRFSSKSLISLHSTGSPTITGTMWLPELYRETRESASNPAVKPAPGLSGPPRDTSPLMLPARLSVSDLFAKGCILIGSHVISGPSRGSEQRPGQRHPPAGSEIQVNL